MAQVSGGAAAYESADPTGVVVIAVATPDPKPGARYPGDTRPPFEKGNVAALTHGGYSPRKVDPLAAEIVGAVREHVTWWRAADEPSIWAWARTEARAQLIAEWLAEKGGDLDDVGAVRPAADLLTKLEARAESMRARLGLEPLSRARLGRDVAAQSVDLARLWAAESAQDGRDGAGSRALLSDTDEEPGDVFFSPRRPD